MIDQQKLSGKTNKYLKINAFLVQNNFHRALNFTGAVNI